MMVVVANLEPLFDQVTEHGSRPDPAGVAGRLRPCIDQSRQLVLLVLRQSGRRPRRGLCQ